MTRSDVQTRTSVEREYVLYLYWTARRLGQEDGNQRTDACRKWSTAHDHAPILWLMLQNTGMASAGMANADAWLDTIWTRVWRLMSARGIQTTVPQDQYSESIKTRKGKAEIVCSNRTSAFLQRFWTHKVGPETADCSNMNVELGTINLKDKLHAQVWSIKTSPMHTNTCRSHWNNMILNTIRRTKTISWRTMEAQLIITTWKQRSRVKGR